MAFLSGKSGSVTVANASWKLREWSLDMRTDASDVTNFSSSGYRENIAGLTGGSLSMSGPYDSASMALTSGTLLKALRRETSAGMSGCSIACPAFRHRPRGDVRADLRAASSSASGRRIIFP